MTSTTLIPGLRDTLPDPLPTDAWPASATAVPGDVTLLGVPLSVLALRAGLPFVHAAGARGVAVGRVIARVDGFGGRVDLVVGVPDDLDHRWPDARLLGRVSHARIEPVRLSSRSAWQGAAAPLPGDVGVGDLLAVPFARA